MSNPTVSVIIPVYNAQEGIKQCLDSLLNQSFTDFEIILLNDGSTDNSLEVIKKYAADNDFIRVIDKENEGVAKPEIRVYNLLMESTLYLSIMTILLIQII